MRMGIVLGLAVLFGLWQGKARAVTAPLAFGVTADSNGTANTVAYRDANGNLLFNYITLATPTTTQLAVLTPTAANQTTQVLLVNGGIGICFSTGTTIGAWIWPSTSSTASLRACN